MNHEEMIAELRREIEVLVRDAEEMAGEIFVLRDRIGRALDALRQGRIGLARRTLRGW